MATQEERLKLVFAQISADISSTVKRGELVYNVKHYGAKGDGVTNDTAAINAAIAAMPSIAGSFGPGLASGELHFPAGRYITDGGHVIPAEKRIRVTGVNQYSSILYRRSGAPSADMLTINAQNSGIDSITLGGDHVTSAGSGDALVLNAAYAYAINATISGHGGNGISVGKASGSILHRLEGVTVRLCRGNGVRVFPGSSTDGEWVNVDIGTSGLAGVRLGAGATQMTNVHVWGSGIEATVQNDKAGFWLQAPGQMLTGCESESNLGVGVLISPNGAIPSDGHAITGGELWGNCLAGLHSYGGTKWHRITGTGFRNNGVLNTDGTTSSGYSSILNESGSEWSICGVNCWDDGKSIPAGFYAGGYIPANPYPGREAIKTVSKHYTELATTTTPDYCSFVGNVWRTTTTRTGSANIFVGTNHQQIGNVSSDGGSDIEFSNPAKGVILRSPNGTRYRLTVGNNGALITTAVV